MKSTSICMLGLAFIHPLHLRMMIDAFLASGIPSPELQQGRTHGFCHEGTTVSVVKAHQVAQ